MSERICILCKHWRFDAGSAGYSDWTPGSEWSMWCDKDRWSMGAGDYEVTEDEYRRRLLTAQTCEDFTPIDEAQS